MPARARKEIVDPHVPGYYMVSQRVVRGLRLTGVEPETGRDFTYRQRKLERRIGDLAGLYSIEVAEFTCGADGFDLLVRTRPDLASKLSDEEVVRRMLRRSEKQLDLKPAPSDEVVREVVADGVRLGKLRARISNLSQFMGDIDEAMARDVNRESGGADRDVPLGRLWHGRFQSVRVLDAPALLLAATHLETKKVVDGEASSLETAENCSVALRRRTSRGPALQDGTLQHGTLQEGTLQEGTPQEGTLRYEGSPEATLRDGAFSNPSTSDEPLRGGESAVSRRPGPSSDVGRSPDAWLLPFGDATEKVAFMTQEEFESGPYLNVSNGEFRQLLSWTLGQTQASQATRQTSMTADLVSLFARFRIRVEVWIEAVLNFRRWYRTAIGLGDALKAFARRLGVAWLAGQGRRRHPFTG